MENSLDIRVELGAGLTDFEKNLIMMYYRSNPSALFVHHLMLEGEKPEIKIEDTPRKKNKKTKEDPIYTLIELTEIAPMKKIRILMTDGSFEEGIHYFMKNTKKIWTECAVQTLKEKFTVSEEERREFENLFLDLSNDYGISANKLSMLVAEKTGKHQKAVYTFFYTLFSKRLNKESVNMYKKALMEIKENLKNRGIQNV